MASIAVGSQRFKDNRFHGSDRTFAWIVTASCDLAVKGPFKASRNLYSDTFEQIVWLNAFRERRLRDESLGDHRLDHWFRPTCDGP